MIVNPMVSRRSSGYVQDDGAKGFISFWHLPQAMVDDPSINHSHNIFSPHTDNPLLTAFSINCSYTASSSTFKYRFAVNMAIATGGAVNPTLDTPDIPATVTDCVVCASWDFTTATAEMTIGANNFYYGTYSTDVGGAVDPANPLFPGNSTSPLYYYQIGGSEAQQIAQVYVALDGDVTAALDLSVANRDATWERFALDTTLNQKWPIVLGTNGELPTGASPFMYFGGNASDGLGVSTGRNAGLILPFTVGTVTDGLSSQLTYTPVKVMQFAADADIYGPNE